MTSAYRSPVESYAGIPPVHSIYLFNDHTIKLPRGHVCVFYGPAGVGKGRVTCNFTARNSRGENAAGEPGTTILITPEDDAAETVAWRLRAEDAVLSRVIDMTTLDGGTPFRLDAPGAGTAMSRMAASLSAGALREKIDTLAAYDDEQRRLGVTDPALMANPNLVIIESLLAIVGGTITTDPGARHVLAPLETIAQETGVTFLITTHSTKGGSDVAGSRALVNAPRVVYEMSRHPDHAKVVRIALRKGTSIADDGGSMFVIDGRGTGAHVVWAQPAATASAVTAAPAWRMRAMQGPLTAIEGAHTAPVPDFSRMTDESRIDHLQAMHGMQAGRAQALRAAPGYLRETLIQMHALGGDDALVPHRHAAAPAMLALTAGRTPAGKNDTTREPRQPAVQVFVAPPAANGAGDESRPAPRAAGTAASRGAQPSSPPARRNRKNGKRR